MKCKVRSFFAVFFALLVIVNVSLPAAALSFSPTARDENGKIKDVKLYSDCVYMKNLDTGEVIVDINS